MSRRSWQPVTPDSGSLRLTETELRRQFDAATFARGDAYQHQGRVLRHDVTPSAAELTVTSLVKGSGGQLYRTEIDIHQSRHGLVCEGFCSCPVEVDCKHVVATLLQMIRKEIPAPPVAMIPQTATPKAKATDPLAGPLSAWLDRLSAHTRPLEISSADSTRLMSTPPAQEALLYCFSVRQYPNGADSTEMALIAARPLKAGGWGMARRMSLSAIMQSQARYVSDRDRVIARILQAEAPGSTGGWPRTADPDSLDWALDRILATRRAYWLSKDGVPLVRGSDRPGRLTWQLNAFGNQVPQLVADEAGLVVLPGPSPWVVDPASGECGKLVVSLPGDLLRSILDVPAIPPEAAKPLAEALALRFPKMPIPIPKTEVVIDVDDTPPIPVLRLATRKLPPLPHWGRVTFTGEEWVDGAWLFFDYGGIEIPAAAPQADIRRVADSTVHVHRRQHNIEREAAARLATLGLVPPHTQASNRVATALSDGGMSFPLVEDRKAYGALQQEDTTAWPVFLHDVAPGLATDGWRIVIEEGFRYRTVNADGDWHADVMDRGGWWFSLDLGIEVEGQRVALLPLLMAALAKLKPGQSLDMLARAGTLYSALPDGRILALPFDRVRYLVEVLVELYEGRPAGDDTALDLTLAQAMGLDAIAKAVRLRWIGSQRLRDLVGRLRKDGISVMDPPLPAGFNARLRDYQEVGFVWMQFLADEGLGGVLADDMGLGKTVQTLAHILAEKEAGKMDAPFLVICPTSLVATWRTEAMRFTPALRLVVMHGHDRPRDAGAFAQADIVISTYPLLIRDMVLLTSVTWHGVVLDEAQAIKNPSARWTQVACRLQAGHRLCLTGTPVENHLGEAWSLFTFLMPGLLGDAKAFTKVFRTPIEKQGDDNRRLLLSRRLKPFLLRRTKTEVAAELPPKTEMVRWIELSGAQRDLYETLRLAMDEKVRQAIAAKGLARSSIIILEALLKLRQVCCDPRLAKMKMKGRTPPGSAKLDYLMELLPALVEEGRRILLFSQFTSMLDLTKLELNQAKIPFVELTGATVDRETPVRFFQEGRVPLFLISLKAGGVGLTLTAADTVIHYDPWWNPAVEDQATDRAHRIGQDKAVLVYKLIAAGTVEERMLDLQARKRNVAAALFDPDAKSRLSFTEEDLAALFQPIAAPE